MSHTLPITVLILAHRFDHKLLSAVKSATFVDELIIGWDCTIKLEKEQAHELRGLHPYLKLVTITDQLRDFAATRNALQEHATHDWVFWLDSDETITSKSIPHLQKILSGNAAGARVQRKDVFHGKVLRWGEVQHVQLLRIYKKDSGHFIRPVHEVVEVTGEIEDTQIQLLHYAHDSITSFLSKVIRYAKIEATFRHQHHKRATVAELLTVPLGKFLANLILRGAWLDGWQGLSYAVVMSIHSLAVRAYLLELQTSDEAST
jgi:hypothetical protein